MEEEQEEDGRLTGEPDPFISSDAAVVVCPAEEGEEGEDLPLLGGSPGSAELLKEDRPETLLTAPGSAAPGAALKARLEGNML